MVDQMNSCHGLLNQQIHLSRLSFVQSGWKVGYHALWKRQSRGSLKLKMKMKNRWCEQNALSRQTPQPPNKAFTRTPQEQRGWRGGSRRVFKQFAWLQVGSVKAALSRPAHRG